MPRKGVSILGTTVPHSETDHVREHEVDSAGNLRYILSSSFDGAQLREMDSPHLSWRSSESEFALW